MGTASKQYHVLYQHDATVAYIDSSRTTQVLAAPELWFSMVDLVDSSSDEVLTGTGMLELIFDIRRQSCALTGDIFDGTVFSGKLEGVRYSQSAEE